MCRKKNRYYELKHASHDELLEALLLKLLSPQSEEHVEILSVKGFMEGEIARRKAELRSIMFKDKDAWECVAERTLTDYRKWKDA